MIDRDTAAIETALTALDPAVLTGLTRQALGGDWHAVDWRFSRLRASVGAATGGVFRVDGTARSNGGQAEWSLILKVVVPGPGELDDPRHALYWKREVLAYETGWLSQLPGRLRGPRCYGIERQVDGSIWLWLEDVSDAYHGRWPLEQYRRAARCLGQFNGAYLAGRPWPPYAWLERAEREPRGVLEAYGWIEALVLDPCTWEHPLLREHFGASLAARLGELWRNRCRLLEAFERLPQTICHQDAWRGNLMATPRRSEDELVIVDWAYTGRGTLGTDLGDLTVAGYGLREIGPNLAEIDDAVFNSYLGGLRDVGWPVDRNQVRFAYLTYAALKYGCLLPWLRDLGDLQQQAFWERVTGQPLASMIQNQAVMCEHLVGLYDEAVPLLETL